MVELRLSQLAEEMNGEILQGSPTLTFHKFNIDSRLTEPGELFFALIAERNGHEFIPLAVKKGAAGAVISQKISPLHKDFALIQVQDTLKTLQKLAKKVLLDHKAKVVGITGSTGKTTTKEFAFFFLSHRFEVLKSKGNFNNHIGLPLSILNLTDEHEIAVLEMGMSIPGEIKTLTQIATPDVAVITNIKPVHLEFFDSLEDIARAKKEILDGAKTDGLAVLNADDYLVKKIAKDWKGGRIFFGISGKCDIQAQNIQKLGMKGITFDLIYGKRQGKITVPLYYESHLYNFLASTGIAYAFNVSFDEILTRAKKLKTPVMRGVLIRLRKNIHLIDDTYNSNPAALELALKSLADFPAKRRVAVLGDMLELGEKEIDFHIQAGGQVEKWGWDILITVGPLSQHMGEGAISSGMMRNQIFSFQDSNEAAEEIIPLLKEGDLILVKGSRGMKTEKIVNRLKKEGK